MPVAKTNRYVGRVMYTAREKERQKRVIQFPDAPPNRILRLLRLVNRVVFAALRWGTKRSSNANIYCNMFKCWWWSVEFLYPTTAPAQTNCQYAIETIYMRQTLHTLMTGRQRHQTWTAGWHRHVYIWQNVWLCTYIQKPIGKNVYSSVVVYCTYVQCSTARVFFANEFQRYKLGIWILDMYENFSHFLYIHGWMRLIVKLTLN